MPTSGTWNNVSYSVPLAGELNWASLSDFLVALLNNAQTTNFQRVQVRTGTTTPITVNSTDDCVILSDLAVAGAVSVVLPSAASVAERWFAVIDAKGDASTNNITITTGAGNINGAASFVIDRDRRGVVIVCDGSNYFVVSQFVANTVDTTATQTLSNKTLANPVVEDYADLEQQGASPANPAANYHRLFVNSTGSLVTRDSAGVEKVYTTDAGFVTASGNNTFTGLNTFNQPTLHDRDTDGSITVSVNKVLAMWRGIVNSPDVVTVQSGAFLESAGSLTVDVGGTLTVDAGGASRVF